jgi:hypothetical protein
MASDTVANNPLSGQVMFYNKPEPLNAARHGAFGLKQLEKPLKFAASTHLVPIMSSEFAAASTSFPIIFIGDDLSPVAVMSVRRGENEFIKPDGEIDPDYYIPAFVRRYPFVFANDEQQKRLVLCVDTQADVVTDKNPDVPFFKDGQPEEVVQQALTFCQDFETMRQHTSNLVNVLKEKGLLETKTASIATSQDGTQTQKIADYMAVSEEKLFALSDADVKELHDRRAFPPIYAHLASLNNWNRVIGRAVRRNTRG